MNRSARAHKRGFTLLEVLIALAVVAVTLLAAMRAVSSLVGNTARLRQAILAETCAENWLGTAQLQRLFPAPGLTTQNCTQGGENFRVNVTATPTLNPAFMRVDVRVNSSNEETVWRVSALLRRP